MWMNLSLTHTQWGKEAPRPLFHGSNRAFCLCLGPLSLHSQLPWVQSCGISPPLPPHVSPCPAEHLCQQAALTLADSPPPSLLLGSPLALLPFSAWPLLFCLLFWCWKCSGFLLCLQENFKLIYGTSHQEFIYLGALSRPSSRSLSFPPLPLITMATLVNFQ